MNYLMDDEHYTPNKTQVLQEHGKTEAVPPHSANPATL